MRDLFRNEHAVNVFMSPFTLSLHLFFNRPLFLRHAVDCHYKTRQTDTRQTGKTRQTVARQTGIASKWDAPNWTASNRHASKRTRQTGLTAFLCSNINFPIEWLLKILLWIHFHRKTILGWFLLHRRTVLFLLGGTLDTRSKQSSPWNQSRACLHWDYWPVVARVRHQQSPANLAMSSQAHHIWLWSSGQSCQLTLASVPPLDQQVPLLGGLGWSGEQQEGWTDHGKMPITRAGHYLSSPPWGAGGVLSALPNRHKTLPCHRKLGMPHSPWDSNVQPYGSREAGEKEKDKGRRKRRDLGKW